MRLDAAPGATLGKISMKFDIHDNVLVKQITFKNITSLISELGGYIVLFYSIFYIFLNKEVFKFTEKQSIKLVDEADNGKTEYSQATLEIIRKRISIESLFTLFDEAKTITESM